MKNSIAIWFDKLDGESTEDVSLFLDLNIWLSRYKNSKRVTFIRWLGNLFNRKWFYDRHIDNYIEFGLKIKNYQKIKHLNIYLPYKISHNDIKDIVPEFTDIGTLNALFNEKMNISEEDGGLYLIHFKNNHKKEDFIASCSYFEKDHIKSIDGGGCILRLEMPQSSPTAQNTLYKRLRINKLECAVTEYSENNFIIDGLFKKLQTVEININSLRRLPKFIVDKMNGNTNIKSVNFFMMTDIFANIIFQSRKIDSSRILEEDIWNKYLGIDKSYKDIKKVVAYQWKYGGDIEDYNLFMKLANTEKRWLLFLFSILIVILFGIIGGYGGNKLTQCLDSYFDCNTTKNSVVTSKGETDGSK